MISDARQSNAALNRREYDEGALALKSLPQYLAVELTQGCNLACPMCRNTILSTASLSMPDAIFDRIAPLFETAKMVDLRGWGESLILADIERRIRAVSDAGAEIRFVTNLAFRRDVSALLAEHACHVAISIDAAASGLYNTLRGGAQFERLKHNLENLVQAYRRRLNSTDRLHFTTTVMQPALEGLPELVRFAARMGIGEIRLFSVTAPEQSPLSLHGCDNRVDHAVQRAAAAAAEEGVRLIAGTRLGSMQRKSANASHCLHPWSYAVVGHDGSVGFCDHLIGPDGADYVVGNLATDNFGNVWNGTAWIELRREHLGQRRATAALFHECAWCYANRFVDFENQFHPRFATERQVLSQA